MKLIAIKIIFLLFWLTGSAIAETQPLWQIGKVDHSAAEFSLAQNKYSQFLQKFGKPESTFYIGLSDAASDWPCVLPGPQVKKSKTKEVKLALPKSSFGYFDI